VVDVVVAVLNVPVVPDVCHVIDDVTGLVAPLIVAVRVIGVLAKKYVVDAVIVIVGVARALTVLVISKAAAKLIKRAVASMIETIFWFKGDLHLLFHLLYYLTLIDIEHRETLASNLAI